MNEPTKEVAESTPQVKHHPNVHPLEGQKFGMLTVLSRDGTSKGRSALWKCLCDCGNIKTVPALPLRQGTRTSCGCKTGENISASKITVNLIGEIFGRLTVISRMPRVPNAKHRDGRWLCKCSCGNESIAKSSNLKSGNCNSCGCLQRELLSKRQTIHGLNRPGNRTRVYGTWCGMMSRCYSENEPAYKHYGLRGIVICKAWHDPAVFATDMGHPPEKHSIERKDNDGGYWCGKCEECVRLSRPFNCIWATTKTQSRNRRNNHMLTFNGETLCLTDMAEKYGIGKTALDHRLKRGIPIELALTVKKFPSGPVPKQSLDAERVELPESPFRLRSP